MTPEEIAAAKAGATRYLSGHGKRTGRAWLDILAATPEIDLPLDVYSDGAAMTALEQQVATLLGKPSALFFHKGVTAQQAALLALATPARGRAIALHPRSHLAEDESDALDRLARLHPVRVGSLERPFSLADLENLNQPLAAITVEIPLRRAGFIATPWDELVAISKWARATHTPFLLDGARIWEVAPYYGRSLAEIAALADVVYVSFYKGLGGMGGCVLAGEPALISACKPWRNRYGGDLPTIFPYTVTALAGLRQHLPLMPDYHRAAQSMATTLAAIPGVRLLTNPPHGNSFSAELALSPDALNQAQGRLAAERGIWLFNRVLPTPLPDRCLVEIVAGQESLTWTADDLAATIRQLFTP